MESNKKRIVFFDGTLMQGGAERVISILSKSMIKEKYNVTILLYYNEEIFYKLDPNVKVVSVFKNTGSDNILINIKWIRQFLKSNADIILSFLAPFNMLAIAADFGLKIPIIVADRNDPRKIPSSFLLRKARDFLYLLADGVVIQTTHNRDYFSKYIQRKSAVIYNPISLNDKKGIATKTVKKKRIVSVGRLMKQKNQLLLLRAFKKVVSMRPGYKLTIYGEGPERPFLEKYILENHLEESVDLPGSVKNVHECIANAEIFVMSSNFEGMPNALIEAMCLGLPSISTKVSGATDLIQDGVNGDLVDLNDEQALADKMIRLIDDDNRRKTYAFNAIELNELLNTETIVKQWIEYINKF
ncbi:MULTISPECIES: glycosyltransferase family 4 protein [Erysipelotrichales]|mgnify:FL=1|uniref:glycosyltransferase family 4 protein n=1 Tax=Erysipelotrichales TaxID=526525 RepID=UPI0018ABED0E|nr:glycosyltransferase family 4 protein [Catenibacterium mitsuokai]